MPVDEQVERWYAAADSREQWDAVRRLVAIASGQEQVPEWRDRSRATRALIELLHLARHPADRVALIRHLGQCSGQFVAVPALHAETHAQDPGVRAAALEAIGRLGLPFGGALVAGWLEDRDPEDEPGPVLEAALVAIARTGHPRVGAEAIRLWSTGRIRAAVLHAALADAVCGELCDLAREHVEDPAVAIPAALHLAAVRDPELSVSLRPMRYGENLAHVHLAERLLALPRPGPIDHLIEVMDRRGGPASLGRAARGLRVHPAEALSEAFTQLAEDIDASGPDGRHWVRVALLTGIPELQRVALELAASGSERTLVQALGHVCHVSPGLESSLDEWERSSDSRLVAAAIRARVNVYGTAALPRLEHYAKSGNPIARLEYVRALQNALRNQRDGHGRTGLPHERRRTVEARIREALRFDDDDVRERAAFASGNIGLTGLAQELRGLLTAGSAWKVRRAAATALSELPPSDDLNPIAGWAAEEPEPEVRFRLIRALLRGVEAGKSVTPAILGVARSGMTEPHSQVAVLSMVLRGACGDGEAVADLGREARGSIQARAAAAITALGQLASASAVPDLVELTSHPDEARRRRAAEALGHVGGTESALALLRMMEREGDPDVRAAAVRSLTRCPAPAAEVHRLRPNGEDDPLMFELLQARMAASAGGRALSASEIDARLVDAIPGFQPGRLAKRVPSALRALRTAEYLDGSGVLPSGLDAAPPVLFWTKGLELWLNDLLAPLLMDLRRSVQSLDAGVPRWESWKHRLGGAWRDPDGQNLWVYLLEGLTRGLRGRRDATLGLRDLGAALLVSGPLSDVAGIGRWKGRWPDSERVLLANRLVELAWWRNPLTHSRAGTVDEVRAARLLALEAARLSARAG